MTNPTSSAESDLILSPGPEDGPVLAGIHAEAFHAPWDAAAFESLLAQTGVFAIRAPDGFILCRVVIDEAEILTLAVLPTARRSGLGARLTHAAAEFAAQAGAERLFLEVAEDNVAARALYDRTGFIQTGRRKKYYENVDGSRSDALLLTRELSQPLPTR